MNNSLFTVSHFYRVGKEIRQIITRTMGSSATIIRIITNTERMNSKRSREISLAIQIQISKDIITTMGLITRSLKIIMIIIIKRTMISLKAIMSFSTILEIRMNSNKKENCLTQRIVFTMNLIFWKTINQMLFILRRISQSQMKVNLSKLKKKIYLYLWFKPIKMILHQIQASSKNKIL